MTEEVAIKAEEKVQDTAQTWPMQFALRKPVLDKNMQPLEKLELREPSAADILVCGGNPVRLVMNRNGGMEFIYEPEAMNNMLCLLSGVPPVNFKKLDPRDWNTAAYYLSTFFVPDLVL